MIRLGLLLLALLTAGPAVPQEIGLPEAVELGIDGRIGDPNAGRDIFGDRCERCHAPARLAVDVYRPSGELIRADVCIFLETHGLVDAKRDCDIVAYLKVLAERQAQ